MCFTFSSISNRTSTIEITAALHKTKAFQNNVNRAESIETAVFPNDIIFTVNANIVVRVSILYYLCVHLAIFVVGGICFCLPFIFVFVFVHFL